MTENPPAIADESATATTAADAVDETIVAAEAADETVTITDAPVDDEAHTATPATPGAEAEAATVEADVPSTEAETPTEVTPEPTPAPTPAPAGRPSPRPRPMPRPLPAPPTTGMPAPAVDTAEALTAAGFGRVDTDGNVWVTEAAGERIVGQVPGVTAPDAMALYVRRFLDLQSKVTLFEARLAAADLAAKDIDQTLARLDAELESPAAVGDLDGLRARLDVVRAAAQERRAAAEATRAAAREKALAERTVLVEHAEKIAATNPASMQWKQAGETMRGLLEEWKQAQRGPGRLDKATEDGLWKRLSHARTTFDRERRHFFAELEQRNDAAKAAKETIVREAESLATSTDWGATGAAFRDLMARWKEAPRGSRSLDDALWARFRAAQDAFFAARDATNAAIDAEFAANLTVKEKLLTEAEALLPVKDLGAAKAALRSIQDRWESAGKVPRAAMARVEARLRAVEQAVRDAEQTTWRKGNPETRARAEGAASQLIDSITALEAELAAATAAGNTKAAAKATEALTTRRQWLEQILRAAQES